MAKAPKDYKRKHEPFEFTLGGNPHKLKAPTLNQMKTAAAVDDFDGMIALFKACGDDGLMADAGDLELPDVKDLFNDWIQSYGDPGKSGGSSD